MSNLILEALEKVPAGGPLLLVFDRDGTLVPYADHPDDAVMDEELKQILVKLAGCQEVFVSMLSARSIKDLEKDFPKGSPVMLAGNYGLELRLTDGSLFVEPQADALREEIRKTKEELFLLSNRYNGSILEDHSLTLCLHWHNVDKKDLPALNSSMKVIASKVNKLRLETYPTSFEFFPDIEWTKGDGLVLIESRSGFRGSNDNGFVMFAGDTDSDEPAIAIANQGGGLSLRVGADCASTAAKYKFESPMQVKELLSHILNLRS